MDQVGNAERITEEPVNSDSEDQRPEGQAGDGDAPDAGGTQAVFSAAVRMTSVPDADAGEIGPRGVNPGACGSTDPSAAAIPGFPDGFTGTLALQNLESFDQETVGAALGRMAHLISWAQAQQARLMNRMEEMFCEGFFVAGKRMEVEPGMAFTLAAAECAAILNLPQVRGERLLFEAGLLTGTHTATLTAMEAGRLSYPHAQVLLDQCENIPPAALAEFEAELLKSAEGRTRAQFAAKARCLREKKYPETVPERHLTAFDKRKVTLDREEDGMSCLSAHLRAAEAQQIYTMLSNAARGEQTDGDPRTTDQLRADVLAQLLMGGLGAGRRGGGRGAGGLGAAGNDREGCVGSQESGTSGPSETSRGNSVATGDAFDDSAGIVPRAEIMVLINAETLFGADDQPAELHGYGPISADEARRLARNAAGWTGLARDPNTGEILGVGRRRKVPAGLRRWLRARDGTCRFPGCRVSTATADIDHTREWADGGSTDHGNLAHLCRRHHRFKTLGYWKATQPTPGVIEWTSPTGRTYRTEPFLELVPHYPVDAPTGPGPAMPADATDARTYAQAGRGMAEPALEQAAPF